MVRFAILLLGLSSVFAQTAQTVGTDETSLINYGIADCLDALVLIHNDSIDTTTRGTGATRTVEGFVPFPANATGNATAIIYTATITRETTSAITQLVVSDLCIFHVGCSSIDNSNFSCSYGLMLATPAFVFNDSFYGTATDASDLATIWGMLFVFCLII